MNILPTLLLSGCVITHSDVDLSQCSPEVENVKQACLHANVIGENSNPDLDFAVAQAKICLGTRVKILCSDPGLGEPRVITYRKE